MKKMSIVLFIVGVILIVVALAYTPTNKEGEWESVYGINDFNNQYGEIIINDFYEGHFNYFAGEKNNQVTFLIPNNVDVKKIYSDEVYYSNNDLLIKYVASFYGNVDDEIQIKRDNYQNQNMKIFIEKKTITSGKTVLHLQASLDKKYIEELHLYIDNNDKTSSVVSYETINKRFSEDFITQIINQFKVESGDNYSSCSIGENNLYNCMYQVNNKKIVLSIDKNKYRELSLPLYNGFLSSFTDISNENNIDISISYDDIRDVQKMIYEQTNTASSNWQIEDNIMRYNDLANKRQINVCLIDEHLALMIDITFTKLINENMIKDFLDFKIIN